MPSMYVEETKNKETATARPFLCRACMWPAAELEHDYDFSFFLCMILCVGMWRRARDGSVVPMMQVDAQADE